MFKSYKLIDSNIRHGAFEDIMELCFGYSDYFTLSDVISNTGHMTIHELTPCLEPYAVHRFRTAYAFLNPTYDVDSDGNLIHAANTSITVYRAELRAKQIILDAVDNIFFELEEFDVLGSSEDGIAKKTTFRGEDICFYMGHNLLLGTLSHEYECVLYPPTFDVLELFQKCAEWDENDLYIKHFLRLKTWQ